MPPKKTPLRAIREKCLECSGGDKQEVRECVIEHCPLHPYRLGIDPNEPLNLPTEDLPTDAAPAGQARKAKPGRSKGGKSPDSEPQETSDQLTLF